MSPLMLGDLGQCARFPRVSGDEPAYWLIGRTGDGFSPRERG